MAFDIIERWKASA